MLDSEIARAHNKCQIVSPSTFTEIDSYLFHNKRLVIPDQLLDNIISKYHNCHFSGNKTFKDVSVRYWAPHLRKHVSQFVNPCSCQVHKSYGHNPPPSNFPLDRIQPFEVVALDIVSLPADKHFRYVLTLIDMKTRLLAATPLTNITAKTSFAEAFRKSWIHLYGAPAVIHTDQGISLYNIKTDGK